MHGGHGSHVIGCAHAQQVYVVESEASYLSFKLLLCGILREFKMNSLIENPTICEICVVLWFLDAKSLLQLNCVASCSVFMGQVS
jgi:hypothetical protein